MINLELQISLVLLFALAGYLLSSRINQSAVVGIILIGIVIGPSVFSLIRYTEAISMLAHLGAIVLLFAIGLEFRIREVYRLKYFFIALIGIILPLTAGYILGKQFGYSLRESMIIAVSLTATSIAITASVLKEMNKLDIPAAKAIIGAAVIDDALGLIALSMVLQAVRGEDLAMTELVIVALKAAAFLLTGAVASPLIKRLFIRLDSTPFAEKHPHFLFIAAIMFCFLYSSLAEIAGLSAIVGAFLAGAVLEGTKLNKSKDLKEGAEYMHMIFGAIFFMSLGILVNLRELTWTLVPFLFSVILVAILTKVLGCGIAAKMAGFSTNESFIIGFGMAPRGEVAMIVALIGLTSQIISQEIYVSIVLMSLVTTLITPLAIKNAL